MVNQLEKVTHMDLNGDGRIGGYPPQYNQYPPAYPQNYNQCYGAPCPPNYGPYGGPSYAPNYGAPCPPQFNQYAGPSYGPGYGPSYMPAPQHGAGGGLINQLEKVTHMDLNGDGRIGGYPPQYNQYGRHY